MRVLFDIGGTQTRIALSRDGHTIGTPIFVATPKTYTEGLSVIANSILAVARGEQIEMVVGGVPGPLSHDRATLVSAPNLPDWAGHAVAADFSKVLSAQVYIENDTALVGLGEATHGSGKGQAIVAYMTVSTGVNGVRVVNGHIDPSARGFEIGHQIIDSGSSATGAPCPSCGGVGELESFISGRAVAAMHGKHPKEISDTAVWSRLAVYLGYGVHNTIVYWSPDIVVIGGSMMRTVGIPIDQVREAVSRSLKIYGGDIPPIVGAGLGDIGGLYGALALSHIVGS
jgi:predicted NBD/HSP70 family sugar kinase